jgi:hypothetical protein
MGFFGSLLGKALGGGVGGLLGNQGTGADIGGFAGNLLPFAGGGVLSRGPIMRNVSGFKRGGKIMMMPNGAVMMTRSKARRLKKRSIRKRK